MGPSIEIGGGINGFGSAAGKEPDGGLGLPPKSVQERMGHSSIVMTMDTYGHLFQRIQSSRRPACTDRRGGLMPRRRKSLDANEQIEEMTRKLASLDRRLANLECLRPWSAPCGRSAPSAIGARMELLELVELAELPIELMGWAGRLASAQARRRPRRCST
jgi:hypothetical protein